MCGDGHAWEALAEAAERRLLDDSAVPAFCDYVSYESQGNAVTSIDVAWKVLRFGSEDGRKVATLLAQIDGKKNVAQIVQALGNSSGYARTLLRDLYLEGVLCDVNYSPVCGITFHDHIVSFGRARRREMLDRVKLLPDAGKSPAKALLLGILVESYHFVEAAASHIAPAVVCAPNQRLRIMFSEFLEEEYLHGKTLRDGLVNDVAAADIEKAFPLPETLAVINYFRWLSGTDVLSYGVAVGVNECPASTPDFHDKSIQDWKKIRDYGVVAEKVFAPFRDHELADIEADHGSLSAECFVDVDSLSAAQQRTIRTNLIGLVQAQERAYMAAKEFYGTMDTFSVHTAE